MSENTRNRIRSGHWATAATLFFGSLLIDLMDGHSTPVVQTLITYARVLSLAVFIGGCLLVLVGRIDRIVRAPEQQVAFADTRRAAAEAYVDRISSHDNLRHLPLRPGRTDGGSS